MQDLTLFVINWNTLGAAKFFLFIMGIVLFTLVRECRRG